MVGTLAQSEERIRYWDVGASIFDGGGGGKALLSMRDNRTGKVYRATGYRFPAGWRDGAELAGLPVPQYVKDAARRNMNKLV